MLLKALESCGVPGHAERPRRGGWLVGRSHSEDEAALLRREQAVDVLVGERELANSMVRHVREHADANATVQICALSF